MASAFAWSSAARARAAAVPEPEPVVEPAPEIPETIEPPREPLPEHVGDYAIEAELGSGGTARVYRGRHVHPDTHHALKVLDRVYRRVPQARQRVVEKHTTAQGARMGTVAYSSPEQLRDPSAVTVRSDIFSLGVVLYEMTTGALPFRGDCDLDVMNAIVAGTYFLPRVIDPQLARV